MAFPNRVWERGIFLRRDIVEPARLCIWIRPGLPSWACVLRLLCQTAFELMASDIKKANRRPNLWHHRPSQSANESRHRRREPTNPSSRPSSPDVPAHVHCGADSLPSSRDGAGMLFGAVAVSRPQSRPHRECLDPVAVIAITIFRTFQIGLRETTILENTSFRPPVRRGNRSLSVSASPCPRSTILASISTITRSC